jgi:hypothetical protein
MHTDVNTATLTEYVPAVLVAQAAILILILVQLLVIQGLPGVGR